MPIAIPRAAGKMHARLGAECRGENCERGWGSWLRLRSLRPLLASGIEEAATDLSGLNVAGKIGIALSRTCLTL
jgi:hypothetical protein